MNVGGEATRSLWMGTKVAPDAAPLDRDEKADVVIIGSGIAGLSTAYELAVQGRDVVVIDRGPIGMGMTARTTGHLTPFPDDSSKAMNDRRGVGMTRLFHRSQCAGIDRIEQIQQSEEIACDFRRLSGYLFPGPTTEDSEIDAELAANRDADIPVVDTQGLPFKGMKTTRCIEFPDQATFHPLKYLVGLARAIVARGGRLYADTPATDVEESADGVIVTTEAGKSIRAAQAVVATNAPINDSVVIHSKQTPYRTYAMAIEIKRGLIWDALYWDMLDPYHYVRLHPGGNGMDHLIVGGADHKSGEENDGLVRLEAIEAWMRNLVPDLGEVTHRWSGQVMDTLDFAAHIGLNPGDQRIHVATGDSGQGMTHGATAGILLSRLIAGDPPDWASVYDPARKPLRAVREFISENFTAVKSFAEFLTAGDVESADAIKPGQGAILRDGLAKVAAYRGEDGELLLRSAVCTHLGCHLRWNSLERCWDCPCHGSHFAPDGSVLNGPATQPLAETKS